MSNKKKRKRALAVSSGGGHWEQLVLISPSMSNIETKFATTIAGLPENAGIQNFEIISDCNRSRPISILVCAIQALSLLFRFRPHLIVSTGAAPGLVFIAIGKLFGARTIWIDSVANGERLSLSGKIAGRFCDFQVTQWSHLSAEGGPHYFGSVL
jgi:UDP-N-acetylglucosamine:LPS N-acetylglucosamine transferase